MSTDVENELPHITQIDPDALEAVDEPGVRIWLENGAKIQAIENEPGSIERQWFTPQQEGVPAVTEVTDDATESAGSSAVVGLEMIAEYLGFEGEADARERWGDECVDALLGAGETRLDEQEDSPLMGEDQDDVYERPREDLSEDDTDRAPRFGRQED